MKVTIREAKRPDTVIYEFPVHPHLGLPYVGARIRMPRATYQPNQRTARIVDYIWDLAADDSGDLEVRMLVAFD